MKRLVTASMAIVAMIASSGVVLVDSASAATPAPSLGQSTIIRLVVRNCEGCTIGIQRGLLNEPATMVEPAQPEYWNGPLAKVRNGVAILSIPTAFTPGSSFTVSAPWESNTQEVTNIALGGVGTPGRTLTSNQAQSRKQASACWAGTTASSTTINVSVARGTMPSRGKKQAVLAIAWASPSVAVIGRLSPTVQGMLSNQDMYFC